MSGKRNNVEYLFRLKHADAAGFELLVWAAVRRGTMPFPMAYQASQPLVDAISGWIIALGVGFVFYRFLTRRLRKTVMITDYRRGVRFVGGVLKGVLEPGSYTYNVRREEITVVDMRPQPVLVERIGFQDALRHDGVISIGASLVVRDPSVAATALRDQINDSYLIVRDTLKAAVSAQIAPSRENTELVQRAIEEAVNAELGRVGMGICELEITELWLGVPHLQASGGSGILQ